VSSILPSAWSERRRRPVPRERLQHPGRYIAGGFGLIIAVGTLLLLLPGAAAAGEDATFVEALFTATSAACLTGLAVVDTGGHWSGFGGGVILALMQVGGLGIMTMATLLAVLVSRRLGLRARLLVQAETRSMRLREVRRLVRNIVLFSLGVEAFVAVVLTLRFAIAYDRPWGSAAYHGLFHAVAAFNSAGLSLNADSMTRYVADPVVTLVVCAAVVVGGLGFPVVFELARSWRRPRTWSVLTYLTLGVSGVLLVAGTAFYLVAEWSNGATFGRLDVRGKMLAAFFASVMPRSGGLNSVDTGRMTEESLLFTDILMFIGGGSAGTAGGIKVTTFGLLAFVLWAEMRGDPHVHVGRRRVPEANQRQALAVALLGLGMVAVSTLVLLTITEHPLDRVLFEAISASCTVGLSTGITPHLGTDGQVVVALLMFVGRIGPLTLASALALRERRRRYEYPEERTIVG
jgi:trk system potassium uptake protein TrkH